MNELYDIMLVKPTGDGHYYLQGERTGPPVDLRDTIWDWQIGADVYVLGKDELPNGIEDIRGLIYNEPDIVMAVVGHDPIGEEVTYWGANLQE